MDGSVSWLAVSTRQSTDLSKTMCSIIYFSFIAEEEETTTTKAFSSGTAGGQAAWRDSVTASR
jgi:hypothetical protein